jgi:DNA-binding transcriptional LysR family regulator
MRGTDFAEMTAFAAIAEHRSFAKAATRLGVAVSTLSHRIRNLEERQGVRLLNRTTRSVAPTEAGERLLAQLYPVLSTLETAARSIDAYRDAPAGHLRLTVPPPAADTIVAPLLARFALAHPKVQLEISVDGKPVDIVRDGFDAGIRFGPLVARDMIALRLGPPVRPAVVAAPAYLTRRGTPKAPDDLAAHECIRIRLPSGGILPWRFQRRGKIVEAAPGGSLVVNDRALELQAAPDGAGIAYLLANRVAALLRNGRLVQLLEPWMPPAASFYLYYPSRRQVPPPLRAFADFMRRETRRPSGTS